MIKFKHFLALGLVICLFQPIIAEKRVKPKSIKELTDPLSPSYVPYPYPKTRNEIISDLKYAIKKINKPQEGKYESFLPGEKPVTKMIELKLLDEDPVYKFGKIIKVKNRIAGFASDYYWIIFVLNRNNSVAARFHLQANGLLGGASAYNPGDNSHYRKTDQDILDIMSDFIGRPVTKQNIKRIERVLYPSKISDIFIPLWEIEMHDGKVYYYSLSRNMFYRISRKIKWKKDNKGNRPDWRKLVPHMEFAFDDIDDNILVFEKIK